MVNSVLPAYSVAEKVDWFEYSVFYTKSSDHVNKPELRNEDEVHAGCFGDALIKAFLGDVDSSNDDPESLITNFFKFVLPDEYVSEYNLKKWSFCDKTVAPYRWRIAVGDENKQFFVLIPMHEASDYRVEKYYCVQNPRRGCLETYNAFIGYKIIISGHNMPTVYHNSIIAPLRFDTLQFIRKVQFYNTLFSVRRIDIALDVKMHFKEIADVYLECPDSFKLPFFKANRYLNYNVRTGAGTLCCGKRGAQSDAYLRIYNKAAEQLNCDTFYPWDDFKDSLETVVVNDFISYEERPWTRFEFELRGSSSINFLGNYFNSMANDVTPGLFIFDTIGIYDYSDYQAAKYCSNSQYYLCSFLPFWQKVIDAYFLYAKSYNESFVQVREELESKQFSAASVGLHFAHNSTPYRTGVRYLSQVARTINHFVPAEEKHLDDFILSKLCKAQASTGDMIEYLDSVQYDFLPKAEQKRLGDLAHFCRISQEKATDLLNQNSLKGYFDSIVNEWLKFKENQIDADLSINDNIDDFVLIDNEIPVN